MSVSASWCNVTAAVRALQTLHSLVTSSRKWERERELVVLRCSFYRCCSACSVRTAGTMLQSEHQESSNRLIAAEPGLAGPGPGAGACPPVPGIRHKNQIWFMRNLKELKQSKADGFDLHVLNLIQVNCEILREWARVLVWAPGTNLVGVIKSPGAWVSSLAPSLHSPSLVSTHDELVPAPCASISLSLSLRGPGPSRQSSDRSGLGWSGPSTITLFCEPALITTS